VKMVKIIVIAVPLGLLVLVGVLAALLSDWMAWVDEKCQEWFEHIYRG
jgi:hypothetical protein